MQTFARKLNLIALALGAALTAPGCATDWFSSSSSDYVAGELSQDVENLPDPNAPPAPPKRPTLVSPLGAPFRESPDRLLLQANAYFEQGKFHDSARLYQKYLATPEAATAPPTVLGQAHYRIAVVARKKMNFAEAKREFETALRYEPQNQQYRFDLGKSAFDGADYATADAAFSALIAQNPNYPQAQYYYGLTLLEGTRRAEAIAPLTKAVGELEAAALLTDKYYALGEAENAAAWEAQTTQIAARLGRPVPAFPNKPAFATASQPQAPTQTAPTPQTQAPAQTAPTPQTQAPAQIAPATQTQAPAQIAPTTQTQAPAQIAPATQTQAPAQIAPAPQTQAPAQIAPATQTQAPAQIAPTPQTQAPAQIAPTTQTQAPAQIAPATQTQAPAQIAPATQTQAPAQIAPATQTQAPAQIAPATQTQAPAQIAPATQTQAPAQIAPTTQTQAPAQIAPTTQTQAPAQIAPTTQTQAPASQIELPPTAQAPRPNVPDAQLQGPAPFVATVAPPIFVEKAVSSVEPLAVAPLDNADSVDLEARSLADATSKAQTEQNNAQAPISETLVSQTAEMVAPSPAPVDQNAEITENAEGLTAHIGRGNPGLFAATSAVETGFRPGSISTTAPSTAQTAQESQIAQTLPAAQTTQEPQIAQTLPAAQTTQEPQIAQTLQNAQTAQEPQIAQTLQNAQTTQESQIAQTLQNAQTAQELQIAQTLPAAQTTQEPQIAQTLQNAQTAQESQIAQNPPFIGPRLPEPPRFDVETSFRRVELFVELENCVAEYFAPLAPIYETAPSPFQVADAQALYAAAPSPSDLAVDEDEEFDENDDFAFASSGTPQTPVASAPPATIGGFGSYQAPTFDATPADVQPFAQASQTPQIPLVSQNAPTTQTPFISQNAPTTQTPFVPQNAQTAQIPQVAQNAPTVVSQYAAPNAVPRRTATPEERLQAAIAAGAEVREISPEEYRRAVSVGLSGQTQPR